MTMTDERTGLARPAETAEGRRLLAIAREPLLPARTLREAVLLDQRLIEIFSRTEGKPVRTEGRARGGAMTNT